MDQLYQNVSRKTAKLITRQYSTSFSLSILLLAKKFHEPIYGIYGFVRLADEIVDSFHGFDKAALLQRFREDTYRAIEEKISLNPALNAFQEVVHEYGIDRALIDAFLYSMEMDLDYKQYDTTIYNQYIFGSAEVVGLMCLKVFLEGDEERYERLKEPARRLGAAFQKINFLRDLRADFIELGRSYFPDVNFHEFTEEDHARILAEIDDDFKAAYPGILALPVDARYGVQAAFMYYRQLYQRIKSLPAKRVLEARVRVPDTTKLALLAHTYIRFSLKTSSKFLGL